VSKAWRVVVNTIVDVFDDHVPGLAAEMAFFAVLSLPPLLLVVFGSVGFLLEGLTPTEMAQLEAEVLNTLSTLLTRETVNEVLAAPVSSLLREGRTDILSAGIILTLWSASRAANVLLRTVVIAYDLEDHRPGWKRRGVAVVITIIGTAIVVVFVPLLTIGPSVTSQAIAWLGLDPGFERVWPFLYWGGVVTVVLVGLTWIYHVTPGWHTPWRRDLPGAVVALALWLIAGAGIRVYTARFAEFAQGDTFAGLAAPLVLLLWVYVSAIALLLGAELNAEIERMWPTIEEPGEA
jgi:membrane protein